MKARESGFGLGNVMPPNANGRDSDFRCTLRH